MKYTLENGILTLFFEGHIDSSNAPDVEKQAFEIIDNNKSVGTVIDAENLEYISSAGLRVILKIRKREPKLKMVNVSSEVYEILDMTGFAEMMNVEKAYRKLSVDGCEKLGEDSNGIVYRYDPEIVVKVYKKSDALDEICRERELARKALILGIPTAIPFDIVKVGDKYASVFELLNAKSFSKLIKAEPENTDYYVGLFVELLKQIHSTEVNPEDMPDMKETALGWADFLKDYLPENEAKKLYDLVDAVPDRHTMIHGDYHTNNVEMQNGEVLLIDMDTLSYGHPVFELASMFLGFVAFGELDHDITVKFMGLPYETTKYIWKKAITLYLNTDNEDKVKEVEEKAQVIGYARLLRRTIRREADTEHGKKQIALCKERLSDLLKRTDSLAF